MSLNPYSVLSRHGSGPLFGRVRQIRAKPVPLIDDRYSLLKHLADAFPADTGYFAFAPALWRKIGGNIDDRDVGD